MSIDSPQFVWPTNFACTIITEKVVVPNSYSINISIVPTDRPPGSISLGFKKLKHFVDVYLHNSIFTNVDNPLVPQLTGINTNMVLLPSEPYDYFVGSVLYSKFLAISEKYFHIDVMSIDSAVGDHIQYNIMHPDECGLDLGGNHWWNMDTPTTNAQSQDTWGDLDINDVPKFAPRIIKGGKSENK